MKHRDAGGRIVDGEDRLSRRRRIRAGPIVKVGRIDVMRNLEALRVGDISSRPGTPTERDVSQALAQGRQAAEAINPARSQLFRAAAIASVLTLATLLRFYGLVRQSAWADEITTLFITDPSASFASFWQRVLSDTHPPLYYLLIRAWSAAFGQSDLAARLPSAIFGVVAVAAAMIAFNGCRFHTRLTLSLFLALSPGAIEYSQEARSYSLLLLLSTIITGACFQFVRASREESGNACLSQAFPKL